MKVFKIKDAATGKFSSGGMSPKFTKGGKAWGQLNFLKSHLRQFTSTGRNIAKNGWNWKRGWWNEIPENWIVVEITENGITEYPAHALYPKTTGPEAH